MEIGNQGPAYTLQVSSQSSILPLHSQRIALFAATSALALFSVGYLMRSYWSQQLPNDSLSGDGFLLSPTSSRWKITREGVKYQSFPPSPSAGEDEKSSEKTVEKSLEVVRQSHVPTDGGNSDPTDNPVSVAESPLVTVEGAPKRNSEVEEEGYEMINTDEKGNLEGSKGKNSWGVYKAIKVFLGIFRV